MTLFEAVGAGFAQGALLTAVSFIVVFGAIVLVHELGHFLVAKAVGVRVKRVYENGEEVLPTDEKLKQLVLVNEEILQPVNVQLIKRRLYERYNQCRRHDSVRWQ